MSALFAVELPSVERIEDIPLDEHWYLWDDGGHGLMVKRIEPERVIGIAPFIFTWAIIDKVDEFGYGDRWCYHDLYAAVAAASVWDGTGEPEGWHRHPMSGRRRPDGNALAEYINP